MARDEENVVLEIPTTTSGMGNVRPRVRIERLILGAKMGIKLMKLMCHQRTGTIVVMDRSGNFEVLNNREDYERVMQPSREHIDDEES